MTIRYRFVTLVALVILMLSTLTSRAQNGALTSEELVKKQANTYFEKGDYAAAFPLYSQLLANYPKDPNYNYRFGVCMLYSNADKDKALPYLEFASKDPSTDKDVWFHLGRAYHLNYRFDEAIGAYSQYKKVAGPKKAEKMQIDNQIAMCKTGRKLLRAITDIEVMDKKELARADFFRSYDLSGYSGKLLVKPDELKTALDKKKNDASVIFLSGEKNEVYFSSYGENEENGKDIYVVRRLPNGGWGKPVSVGYPINTEYDEDYPFLHPNGKVLYFCSKGHNSMGGYDIFKSELNEETNTWQKPVNLDFAINSPDDDILFVTDMDEKTAYFASARNSPDGQMTVYHVNIERKPVDNCIVKGNVRLMEGAPSRSARILVKNEETGEPIGIYKSNESTGDYLINLPNTGGKFSFTVEKSGQETQTQNVFFPPQYEMKPIRQEIGYREENNKEQLFVMTYFDDDTSMFSPDFLKAHAKLDVNYNGATITELNSGTGPSASNGNGSTKPKQNNGTTNNTANTNSDTDPDTTDIASNVPSSQVKNISNEELLKIAYDDAKETKQEATDLREEADRAMNYAVDLNQKTKAQAETATQAKQAADALPDGPDKVAAQQKAAEEQQEADALQAQTVAAYGLAQALNRDAERKAKESKLSDQYAASLDKAVKSKDPKAFDAVTAQETQLDAVSAEKPEGSETVKNLQEVAEAKRNEAQKATDVANQLREERKGIEDKIARIKADEAKEKDPDLKAGMVNQIEGLEEELADNTTDLKKAEAKEQRLQNEANVLDAQAKAATDTYAQAKNTTVAATTVKPEDAAALKQDVSAYERQVVTDGGMETTTLASNVKNANAQNNSGNGPTNNGQNNSSNNAIANNNSSNNNGNTNSGNGSTNNGQNNSSNNALANNNSSNNNGNTNSGNGSTNNGQNNSGNNALANNNASNNNGNTNSGNGSTNNGQNNSGNNPVANNNASNNNGNTNSGNGSTNNGQNNSGNDPVANNNASNNNGNTNSGNGSTNNGQNNSGNDPVANNNASNNNGNTNSGNGSTNNGQNNSGNDPLANNTTSSIVPAETVVEKLNTQYANLVAPNAAETESSERQRAETYRNWANALDTEIDQREDALNAATDPKERQQLKESIAALESEKRDKLEAAQQADKRAEELATTGIASNNNNNNNTTTNAEQSLETKFGDELAATDTLTTSADREKRKADIYTDWSKAIDAQIGEKKQALAALTDKTEKAQLKADIKQLETESAEKKNQAKASATLAAKQADADAQTKAALTEIGTPFEYRLKDDAQNYPDQNSRETKNAETYTDWANALEEAATQKDAEAATIRDKKAKLNAQQVAADLRTAAQAKRNAADEATKRAEAADAIVTNNTSTNSNANTTTSLTDVQFNAPGTTTALDRKEELRQLAAQNRQRQDSLNQLAANAQGAEKNRLLKEATEAQREAWKNESEASTQQGIANESQYKTNQEALNRAAAASNENDPIAQKANALNAEAQQLFAQAQQQRQTANAASDPFTKKENLRNADENERLALLKQQEALQLYNTIVPNALANNNASNNNGNTNSGNGSTNNGQNNSGNNALANNNASNNNGNTNSGNGSTNNGQNNSGNNSVANNNASNNNGNTNSGNGSTNNGQNNSGNNALANNNASNNNGNTNSGNGSTNNGQNNSGNNSVANNNASNNNGNTNSGNGSTSNAQNNSGNDPLANTNNATNNNASTGNALINPATGQPFTEKEIETVRNTEAFQNYADLNDQAVNAEEETISLNRQAAKYQASADFHVAESQRLSEVASNETNPQKRQQYLNDAQEENRLARLDMTKRDSMSDLAGNAASESRAKRNEADLFLQELDKNSYEQVKLIAEADRPRPQAIASNTNGQNNSGNNSVANNNASNNNGNSNSGNGSTNNGQNNSGNNALANNNASNNNGNTNSGNGSTNNGQNNSGNNSVANNNASNNNGNTNSGNGSTNNGQNNSGNNSVANNNASNNNGNSNSGNGSTNNGQNNSGNNSVANNNASNNNNTNSGNGATNNGQNNSGNNALANNNNASNNNGNSVTNRLAPGESFQTGATATNTGTIPINTELPEGLVFKVQVGAFRNPINAATFTGISPLTGETTPQGLTRYFAGLFKQFPNADAAKNEIRRLGYPDAFVVAFYNGKRISMAEALRMSGQSAGTTIADNGSQNNGSTTSNNGASNTNGAAPNNNSSNTATNTATNNNASNAAPATDVAQVQGLFYTVQVGVFSRPVSRAQLYNLTGLFSERTANGYIRYAAGSYSGLAAAAQAKNEIVNTGVKDAFVTAYFNGKRISIEEARRLEAGGTTTNPQVINATSGNTSGTTQTNTATQPQNTQPQNNNTVGTVPVSSIGTAVANPVNDTGLVFLVQLGAFRENIPQRTANNFLQFAGRGVQHYQDANTGYTVYTVGQYNNYEQADILRDEAVSKGITDAFITAWYGGKRITIAEAMQRSGK